MDRICMYTPSSEGGHARYSWELLSALVNHPRADHDCRFELTTARDLDPQFDSDLYTINRLLPSLCHRGDFNNRFSWI